MLLLVCNSCLSSLISWFASLSPKPAMCPVGGVFSLVLCEFMSLFVCVMWPSVRVIWPCVCDLTVCVCARVCVTCSCWRCVCLQRGRSSTSTGDTRWAHHPTSLQSSEAVNSPHRTWCLNEEWVFPLSSLRVEVGWEAVLWAYMKPSVILLVKRAIKNTFRFDLTSVYFFHLHPHLTTTLYLL